jgi:hypothetical protein
MGKVRKLWGGVMEKEELKREGRLVWVCGNHPKKGSDDLSSVWEETIISFNHIHGWMKFNDGCERQMTKHRSTHKHHSKDFPQTRMLHEWRLGRNIHKNTCP